MNLVNKASKSLDKKNILEELKALEQFSQEGNVQASIKLGNIYFYGLDVNQDYSKAIRYYTIASDLGNADAANKVASMYRLGLGVEKDHIKAVEIFEQASNNGSVKAKFNLGGMYFRGEGVKQDYVRAMQYYKEAADLGEVIAKCNLGKMYKLGLGVEQDYVKAKEYLEQASALGDASAKLELGKMYLYGEGAQRNFETAIQYLQEASQLGESLAKIDLGHMYEYGFGFKQDYEKAIKCYEDVLKIYPNEPVCLFTLSKLYIDLYYDLLSRVENKRTKKDILDQQRYKRIAQKYLKLAEENKDEKRIKNLVCYNEIINIYKKALNEEKIELANMSYEQFKERFFNKHPNIFLLSTKPELELYEQGIKRDFEKRAGLQEKIYLKIEQVRKQFEKDKPIIINRYKDLKIANIEETLTTKHEELIRAVKDETMIDFSDCVVNIDKYIEQSLRFIFKDGLDLYKKGFEEQTKEKYKEELVNIFADGESLDEGFVIKLFAAFHGTASVKKSKAYCLKKIKDFISNKPDTFNVKLNNIKQFLRDNEITLDKKEIAFVKNVLKTAEECETMETLNIKPNNNQLNKDGEEGFTLGKVFFSVFTDCSDSTNRMSTRRMIDENVKDFIQSIHPDKDWKELKLKLNELINKIELFRVVVRNIASHETELSQKSVEEGLNICIMQDNSIFALIDELFGEYIHKRYIDINYIEPLLGK